MNLSTGPSCGKAGKTPNIDDPLFRFNILLHVLDTEVSLYLYQYLTP